MAVWLDLRSLRSLQPSQTQTHHKPENRRFLMCYGGEFISKAVEQWAYENGVEWHFIEPGKPTENAYIESFNGKFRDECLNENWFTTLADARQKIEYWRQDYNQTRPYSSLGYRTPNEFRLEAAALASSPPTTPVQASVMLSNPLELSL